MAFNKKELDQSFKSFSIDGFIFKKEIMGYSWTKEYANRKEKIIIGYRGYPDSYVIYTPTVDIYFPEVESILENHDLGEEYKSTFGKAFQDLQDVDYEKLSAEINSNESFAIIENEIVNILEKGVNPFLSRFTSLEEIADFLADKKPVEIVPFIQGSILYPKTVLIMKLAKHPNFEKRLIEFRNILSENVDASPRYPILLGKYNILFSEDLKAV
jgi:hypothetical protein